MRSRSFPLVFPTPREPGTARTRVLSRALLALACAAGLSLIGIAVVVPQALSVGMPVALLFYPMLWAAAIAAVRRY